MSSGHGARFPAAPFYAYAVPTGVVPTRDNAEKVLVTAKATDVFTITRAQGDTTAKSIAIGWSFYESAADSIAVAASRTAAFMVAANDATLNERLAADYLCDGTADDVQIQAALDALPSTGGKIVLSSGKFNCSSAITRNDRSFVLEGQGIQVTILEFTGSNGIVSDTNAEDKVVSLKDFTLQTTNAGGFDAITLEAANSASNPNPQFLLENLNIRPSDPAADYWRKGIVLTEAWETIITNVSIRGKNNDLNMTSGLEINAQTINLRVTNLTCYFMVNAVHIPATLPEGLLFTNLVAVYVNYGIQATGALQLEVKGGHVAAFESGILLTTCAQAFLDGVLIYKREDSTANFEGINLAGACHNTRIVGCMVRGTGVSGSDNGIALTDENGCAVIGNVVNDQDGAGIWLKSGTGSNTVVGNTGSGNGDGILDQGTANVVSGNVLT